MLARYAAISLIFGVVSTCVVAWVAALWSPVRGWVSPFPTDWPDAARSNIAPPPGVRVALPPIEASLFGSRVSPHWHVDDGSSWISMLRAVGPGYSCDLWTRAGFPGAGMLVQPAQEFDLSSGWPWKCLRATAHRSGAAEPEWHGGVSVGNQRGAAARPAALSLKVPRVLPFIPLPLPFCANVAAFAACACALLLGCRAARRASRTRRGRCVKCAYEVGSLTRCPECGTDHRRRLRG